MPPTRPRCRGSAAGTFGLTSERNTNDNYLLVIEGAFAGHQDGAIRLGLGKSRLLEGEAAFAAAQQESAEALVGLSPRPGR